MVFLLTFILIFPNFSSACINSADSFALEVVFNKNSYNPNQLSALANTIQKQNSYILQSQYNRNLAAILTEMPEDNSLSLRLQIPVETATTKIPYFSSISTITGRKINITQGTTNYKEWIIIYTNNIEMKKEKLSIIVASLPLKYEIFLEINQKLQNCNNCEGKCVYNEYENTCITKKLESDIEDILKFSGLINNFNEVFQSYRVTGKGEKTITDLKPLDIGIDWQEAIKQELVWLKDEKIINITHQDIEEISQLSEEGKAGNSKIVYSDKEEKWLYYYETPNPDLAKELNCKEFLLSDIPKNLPIIGATIGISTYYLIPIILAFLLLLTLVILFLIARTINKRKMKNLLS